MKKKRLTTALLVLALCIPAFAVFDEKDLSNTLAVLRYELHQEVQKKGMRSGRMERRNNTQHTSLIQIIKKCNELALVLYSQGQDGTFDMTYALKEVTQEYEDFSQRKMPFDEMISRLALEIDRYSRLIESLRRLPPQLTFVEGLPDSLAYHNDSIKDRPLLPPPPVRTGNTPDFSPSRTGNLEGDIDHDMEKLTRAVDRGAGMSRVDSLTASGRFRPFYLDENSQVDRDSCLVYATTLLKMYSRIKQRVIADSEHYQDASDRLKESYDYAQSRYRVLQKRMFTQSMDNYFRVLTHLGYNFKRAHDDAVFKYSSNFTENSSVKSSEWRGPLVVSFIWLMLLFLGVSTLLSAGITMFLSRYVKGLKSDSFLHRKKTCILIGGVILFTLAILVARQVISNNFFRLAGGLLMIVSWLLLAILLSVLIRVRSGKLRSTMSIFMPVVLLGIVVIGARIVFLPNSVMNLVFPPVLLLFTIWQLVVNSKHRNELEDKDEIAAWITLAVFVVSTFIAWIGYLFFALLIVIWWLFQLSIIESMTTICFVLQRYERTRLQDLIDEFKKSRRFTGPEGGVGLYIRVTWLSDFVNMVVVPVIGVLSVPLSIWLALNVFDFTSIFNDFYTRSFFDFVDADGNEILHLSIHMIVLSVTLFFVFKYVAYVAKAVYREVKIRSIQARSGRSYIHSNEVNLTLANNIIALLVWGFYVILLFILLKIPTGAISIVAAGLATGIGLAMKDVLNNFIYGIQLMSGRLRVGDWMECGGIRGRVQKISYQSTQIETVDGAVMSFLNAQLFNLNFKNLTRNNAYELVKIGVGVAYGTDVAKVRELLLEALKPLSERDFYGRALIDRKKGITVTFEDFGDSSVDLSVKQMVLVHEKYIYIAEAKEIIYNTLNANGITIPFPQRDIHVIEDGRPEGMSESVPGATINTEAK